MKPSIINGGLSIGSFYHSDKMQEEDWEVVCVASGDDVPEYRHNYPMIDGRGNSKENIKSAILKIVELWNDQKKVYVCCRQGMNRSVSVAAAAMAASGRKEWLSNGLRAIMDRRAVASPRDDTLSEVLEALMEIRPVKESRTG